jgi:hypothetical protein
MTYPGKSSHVLMVDAIKTQTAQAERRRAFVDTALKAEQEVAQYGLAHDADEVFSYVKAKVEGRAAKRPKARRL